MKLKIHTTPCLCPPCIADNDEECENSMYTDQWKEVELKPAKGYNKQKHMKRKHPQEYVCIQRTTSRNDEEQIDDASDEESLPQLVLDVVDDEEDL